jgi:hypothetical protein
MKAKHPIEDLTYVYSQLQKAKKNAAVATFGSKLRRDPVNKVYQIILEYLAKRDNSPNVNSRLNIERITESGVCDWELEFISMQVGIEIEMRKSNESLGYLASLN